VKALYKFQICHWAILSST